MITGANVLFHETCTLEPKQNACHDTYIMSSSYGFWRDQRSQVYGTTKSNTNATAV